MRINRIVLLLTLLAIFQNLVFSQDEKIEYDQFTSANSEINVVFLHGWGINRTFWSGQIDHFKEQYNLYNLDLPGFGESEVTEGFDFSIQSYAKVINTFLEKKKLTNLVLVGHSMSSDIIIEVALNNNDVLAIVGVDAYKDVNYKMEAGSEEELNGFYAMLESSFNETVEAYGTQVLLSASSSPELINRVVNSFQSNQNQSAIAALKGVYAYAPKEGQRLSEIKNKVYLINSDREPSDIASLDQLSIDYKLMEVKSLSHFPMVDAVKEFNMRLGETLIKISKKLTGNNH